MRVFSVKTKTNFTNKRNHTLIDESNWWCRCSAQAEGKRLDGLQRVRGGVGGGETWTAEGWDVGGSSMSGSAQYINPVTAARGSRAVRCNITWAVERLPLFNVLSSSLRLQTVLLIERAKWISAYVCLSVRSLTTMGPWRNVYDKTNTSCIIIKSVYSYYYCLHPILMTYL